LLAAPKSQTSYTTLLPLPFASLCIVEFNFLVLPPMGENRIVWNIVTDSLMELEGLCMQQVHSGCWVRPYRFGLGMFSQYSIYPFEDGQLAQSTHNSAGRLEFILARKSFLVPKVGLMCRMMIEEGEALPRKEI
jgi:hypothetical protein